MNLKRGHFIFILQICPMLVYGTINITSTGTQIIGEKLVLTCTLSPFTGTASWNQDGTVRSTCTPTFCTVYTYGTYTTFSNGSNYINVTFDPVDSSIDGVWECTHSLLGSDSFNVTAINKTQSSGGTNTSTDNDEAAIGILFGCLVIAYIIVIIALRLYIGFTRKTSGNCFLTFCQFIKEKLFDCCRNKLRQGNWVLGFMYLVLYGVIVGVIVLLPVYYGFSKFQEGLVIGVGFVIVLVLSCLCLVVVWILIKFVNNGASRSLSCILNGTVTPQDNRKSQKKATVDKRQQPDGDEGPQSTSKDPDARHLTTGRPLPRRPDIALPQTGSFDSVHSPRPNVLAPIENPNILPSIDTLDEQKTDKKPKDKKKKKKKKKDEEQDNPADVQDNNLLT